MTDLQRWQLGPFPPLARPWLWAWYLTLGLLTLKCWNEEGWPPGVSREAWDHVPSTSWLHARKTQDALLQWP